MISRFSRLPRTLGVLALAALGIGAAKQAQAFPAFTPKEGKPCGYCHVNIKGAGPRNYRGVFYKEHDLTFAKFDDAAEAKKAGVEVGFDPDPKTPPKSWTAPDKAAEPENPAEDPKPEGPVTEPDTPKTATPTMTVAQAKANLKSAEAQYKKTPKNVAKKNVYAEALAQLGRSTMLDQGIPPAKRYPEALTLYRRALALNPKNKIALADKKQIEDVYKQMGRPVPK